MITLSFYKADLFLFGSLLVLFLGGTVNAVLAKPGNRLWGFFGGVFLSFIVFVFFSLFVLLLLTMRTDLIRAMGQ